MEDVVQIYLLHSPPEDSSQQPVGLPVLPQILVLTDQMMDLCACPDKYLHVLAMVNYSMTDYTRDVEDELVDLNFPFIIVFLGTMQLGVYGTQKVQKEVTRLMRSIQKQISSALVTFTSLVPRLMDHLHSRSLCEKFARTLEVTVQDMQATCGWNCNFVDVYQEFLNRDGSLKNPTVNFVEELYLSPTGIRLLRAMWLRHLGFFPLKNVK